jgi:ribosomal protein S18 acetylase RimI-like enzyme
MALTIRLAEPRDAEIVAEYNRRMAWETEAKRLDAEVLLAGVAAVLGDRDKGVYYVASDGEAVIGQVMLTREWSDWRNGWWWWLQSVYIRAESRRQGVFQSLYAHVLQEARATPQVLGLRLYVEQHNAAAQATYRKLGMKTMNYVFFDFAIAIGAAASC